MVKATDVAALAAGVLAGDRRALARAITLVEARRADRRAEADALLAALGPARQDTLRIGLTGAPGVGKSTFIEAFGVFLTARGHRVAVLAVDPSSARSGGSILGDKTRMERLARDPAAFIRPSPSDAELGGVARRTREATILCEAAGFDVVLIETVGVGQSETLVAGMSDLFVLLVSPAGGDGLQGVKRGILELADLLLVTKADGDLLPAASRTLAEYAGALRLFRHRPEDPEGGPEVLAVSSAEARGIEAAWAAMERIAAFRRAGGAFAARRAAQARQWFEDEVRRGLVERLAGSADLARRIEAAGLDVAEGRRSARAAAAEILRQLG